ncbi:hypothetical protein ACWD0J_04350 [Streptomyces sp. NPDC003011]
MRVVSNRLGRTYKVEARPLNDDGGQAVLYRCEGQDGRRRVYKEYRTPVSASPDIDRLHRLALIGDEVVRRAEGRDGTGRGNSRRPRSHRSTGPST